MNANDDSELLRCYADERDEAAFEEIVRRQTRGAGSNGGGRENRRSL